MSTLANRLAKLENEIKNIKLEISNEPIKKTKKIPIKKTPTKIEDCTCIEQLNKHFTVTDLKEWLKKHKINVKKVNDKHKDDFVKIVWENISDDYESEDYSDSGSDVESDEEWEYYYQ